MKLFEGNFKVGDWVKGKSRDGELIYGYIKTINPSKKAALINVVKVMMKNGRHNHWHDG
ncbi:hypothetical protein AAAC51_34780 [Priestia megaterium]